MKNVPLTKDNHKLEHLSHCVPIEKRSTVI